MNKRKNSSADSSEIKKKKIEKKLWCVDVTSYLPKNQNNEKIIISCKDEEGKTCFIIVHNFKNYFHVPIEKNQIVEDIIRKYNCGVYQVIERYPTTGYSKEKSKFIRFFLNNEKERIRLRNRHKIEELLIKFDERFLTDQRFKEINCRWFNLDVNNVKIYDGKSLLGNKDHIEYHVDCNTNLKWFTLCENDNKNETNQSPPLKLMSYHFMIDTGTKKEICPIADFTDELLIERDMEDMFMGKKRDHPITAIFITEEIVNKTKIDGEENKYHGKQHKYLLTTKKIKSDALLNIPDLTPLSSGKEQVIIQRFLAILSSADIITGYGLFRNYSDTAIEYAFRRLQKLNVTHISLGKIPKYRTSLQSILRKINIKPKTTKNTNKEKLRKFKKISTKPDSSNPFKLVPCIDINQFVVNERKYRNVDLFQVYEKEMKCQPMKLFYKDISKHLADSEYIDQELIKYGFRCSRMCIDITIVDELIEQAIEMARLSHTKINDRWSRGNSYRVLCKILSKLEPNYVIGETTKEFNQFLSMYYDDKKSYKGGLVANVKAQFINEPVIEIDKKGCYPSTIMQQNLCFTNIATMEQAETINKDRKKVITLKTIKKKSQISDVVMKKDVNVAYIKTERTILPEIMKELNEYRDLLKELLKTSGNELYDLRQKIVKILMNTFYGVLGSHTFILHNVPLASTITLSNREHLLKVKKRIEDNFTVHIETGECKYSKFNYNEKYSKTKVFYYDTDGLSIKFRPKLKIKSTYENYMKIATFICKQLNEVQAQIDGVEDSIITLEPEAIISQMIFYNCKNRSYRSMKDSTITRKGTYGSKVGNCDFNKNVYNFIESEILTKKCREDRIEEKLLNVTTILRNFKKNKIHKDLNLSDFICSNQYNSKSTLHISDHKIGAMKCLSDELMFMDQPIRYIGDHIEYLYITQKKNATQTNQRYSVNSPVYVQFASPNNQQEINLEFYMNELRSELQSLFFIAFKPEKVKQLLSDNTLKCDKKTAEVTINANKKTDNKKTGNYYMMFKLPSFKTKQFTVKKIQDQLKKKCDQCKKNKINHFSYESDQSKYHLTKCGTKSCHNWMNLNYTNYLK